MQGQVQHLDCLKWQRLRTLPCMIYGDILTDYSKTVCQMIHREFDSENSNCARLRVHLIRHVMTQLMQ